MQVCSDLEGCVSNLVLSQTLIPASPDMPHLYISVFPQNFGTGIVVFSAIKHMESASATSISVPHLRGPMRTVLGPRSENPTTAGLST